MSHDQETTIADVLRGRMATYQFLSRLFRVEVDQELYDTLVSMRFPTNTGNALVDEGYRMICGYLSQADGTVLPSWRWTTCARSSGRATTAFRPRTRTSRCTRARSAS